MTDIPEPEKAKKKRTIYWILFILIVFGGVILYLFIMQGKEALNTNTTNTNTETNANANTNTQVSCIEAGGIWGTIGLTPDQCNFRTSDSGTPCRDSSECESKCFADESDINETAENVNAGDAVGTCAAWTKNAGCRSEIINGSIQPVICID